MGYLDRTGSSPRASASTFTTSLGVALTAPGVLNTKGAYVDLLTPTPDPGSYILVTLTAAGVAAAQALVDIAVGSAGNEHIIAANLGLNSGTDFHTHAIQMPVSIPINSTIRARYQRSNASLTVRASVHVFSAFDTPSSVSRIITLGADTTDSGGTSVDPGAVINTKGSYVQLTSSTTEPINQLFFFFGNQANSVRTDARYLMDVAVGAAASESVIIPNIPFSATDVVDEFFPNYIGPVPCSIPMGSRVAVRGQCSISDATDRLFDVIVYGVS